MIDRDLHYGKVLCDWSTQPFAAVGLQLFLANGDQILAGTTGFESDPKMVGQITQLLAELGQIRPKKLCADVFGTEFMSWKTCV